jgi:protocatechuate 3,4-dioxygenase beta subunit
MALAPRHAGPALVVLAVLLSLVGLVGGAPAAPAGAAGTGTLAGRVVSQTGSPLEDVLVDVLTPGLSTVGTTQTDADGRFRVTVPAGSYRVEVSDVHPPYTSATHHPGGTGPPPPVVVSEGVTTSLVDTVLAVVARPTPPGTAVRGTVTDQDGRAVAGAVVLAHDADGDGSSPVNGTEPGFTDRHGVYFLPSLPAGGYRIEFRTGNAHDGPFTYATSWSGGATAFVRASTVTLTAPTPATPVGLDARLTAFGGIAGTLTGSVPMTAGSVQVYDEDSELVATLATGTSGAFSLSSLAPGSYRLRFSSTDPGPSGPRFVRSWWPGAASFADARPVLVRAAATTDGLDQQLTTQLTAYRPPTIAGTPRVGQELTAERGLWSINAGTRFGYEWLRDGAVVGTGATYRLVAADAGRRLGVRVSATAEAGFTGTALSAASAVVQHGSRTTTTGRYDRRLRVLTLTAVVRVPGVADPRGTVTVSEGARAVGARTAVRRGRAVVTLRRPEPGRHTYVVTYSGTPTVAGGTTRVSVRVR